MVFRDLANGHAKVFQRCPATLACGKPMQAAGKERSSQGLRSRHGLGLFADQRARQQIVAAGQPVRDIRSFKRPEPFGEPCLERSSDFRDGWEATCCFEPRDGCGNPTDRRQQLAGMLRARNGEERQELAQERLFLRGQSTN